MPGSIVQLSTAGGTPGQFIYAALSRGVTLQPNTDYFLFSQETAGGDSWYDYGPVTSVGVATVNGPAYIDGNGNNVTINLPGQAYGPVNFTYGASAGPAPLSISFSLSDTGQRPFPNGAILSGGTYLYAVTTGRVASVQLQVDGQNYESAFTYQLPNLVLVTQSLSNGPHNLRAVAADQSGKTAVSTTYNIVVRNGS